MSFSPSSRFFLCGGCCEPTFCSHVQTIAGSPTFPSPASSGRRSTGPVPCTLAPVPSPLYPRPCNLLSASPLVNLHRLKLRLMRQLLRRFAIPIQLNHVHVLKVSKLSGYDPDQLPTLHANFFTFLECHAQVCSTSRPRNNHSNGYNPCHLGSPTFLQYYDLRALPRFQPRAPSRPLRK